LNEVPFIGVGEEGQLPSLLGSYSGEFENIFFGEPTLHLEIFCFEHSSRFFPLPLPPKNEPINTVIYDKNYVIQYKISRTVRMGW